MPRTPIKSKNRVAPAPAPTPAPTRSMSTQPLVSAPGFGQMVKEGFAVGTGIHIARHAVDGVFGMFSSKVEPSAKEDPCIAYKKCLDDVEKETCDKIFIQCKKD